MKQELAIDKASGITLLYFSSPVFVAIHTIICILFIYFWGHSCFQKLFLALHPTIIPGGVGDHNGVEGDESRSAVNKARALPVVLYLFGFV